MESPAPDAQQPHPAPLERLPLHLFEEILQDVPRRSLFPLSLASRFCCEASTPGRFARVRLRIVNKAKLRGDLRRWAAILDRGNRFRHVRKVKVVGRMEEGDPLRGIYVSSDQANDNDDSDTDDDDTETPSYDINGYGLTTEHKRERNEAWLPFAEFLGQLPAVTDLVYSCAHQLPACVLTALQQHHPKSRLHVRTFSLRSLYQDWDQLHDIDPDEFALATSPCLYSIRAQCALYDEQGRFSFNAEALAYMVTSGCAPGLRHLSLQYVQPGNSPSLLQAVRAPRAPWEGFFRASPGQPAVDLPQNSSSTVSARARLETLILIHHLYRPYHLEFWRGCIDFGTLRHLDLNSDVSLPTLQTLASIAAGNEFRSLEELGLTLPSDEPNPPPPPLPPTTNQANNDTAPALPSADLLASQFLQALPPLTALTLRDNVGEATFRTTLYRHGPSLRKLHLFPPYADDYADDVAIESDRVRALARARPPRLEDVRLRVRRRQGAPEEAAVYRALGRLPRLRRATLVLDCRVPLSGGGGGGGGDEPDGKFRQLREMFANLAVDETLARAILREMAPAADSPLQRLRLEVAIDDAVAGEEFEGLREWAKWIGRSCVCTKYGARGEVTVRETGWGWKDEKENLRNELELLRHESVHYEYEQACGVSFWSELWPRRVEDWRDDWHSFPLSGQGADAGVLDDEESEVDGN